MKFFLLEKDLIFSISQMVFVHDKLIRSTVYLDNKAVGCDRLIHEKAVLSPQIIILFQVEGF